MKMKDTLYHVVLTSGLLFSTGLLADSVPELDCLIEPNMVIELSSPVSGVLDSISVDRSDTVTKGEIVATLKSDVEQVKLKASQETLNLNKVEQKRSIELYRDNAITLSDKEQSDHEVAISELEVESARANLELRKIRSPIDGVVADRYLMPGEFIEDNPILKIAQLDPLRVEVVAPVTHFGRIQTGMHAQVKTEFGSFDKLVAEVVVVDKVIDAASGTFGIRLELPNEDNEIPGGLKCSVRFFDDNEETEYLSLHGEAIDSKPDVAPAIIEQNDSDENPMLLCRRIGPFKDKDRLELLIDALEDAIDDYQVRDDISTTTAYQVTTQAFATEADAKQIETELKTAGVKDIAMVKSSAGFRISLGLFSKEQSAQDRQANIEKLGHQTEILERSLSKATYWAEITTDRSEDELSGLVQAANVKGTDNLLYQSCTTEVLASGREP
jgi:RND family efflux transporter MFP subunit